MMLCLAVTLKEPVSESDIHETVVDSRGVSAVFPRQSLPADPLRLHSTSGLVVDQQPPSSARTPGRPLKVCSVCVEGVCYNYDDMRWSESKRTEFLGEFALLADGLRLLNAHPPGHPEIGEDLAEPPDLVRRLVETLELLRPHFADPARDHERLWQTESRASALSAYTWASWCCGESSMHTLSRLIVSSSLESSFAGSLRFRPFVAFSPCVCPDGVRTRHKARR